MKINVTKADIRNGEIGSFSSCPVGLAIRRATKQKFVKVGREYISFGKNTQSNIDYKTYKTPNKVARFIATFDAEDKVKPFSFTLNKFWQRLDILDTVVL